MQSMPDKIRINISSDDKSVWDCAENIIYPRILDANEINPYDGLMHHYKG
jgi:hypothetical protein